MVNEEISLFDDERLEKNNRQYKLKATTENGHLIKSKDRVQHHGEVFTPKWMVKQMLAEPSIQSKLNDIHATFFEPSAGEGAFLKEILHQKLNYVDHISNKSNWKNNKLQKGDLVNLCEVHKKHKRKNVDGKWIESEDFELWTDEYFVK